MTRKTKFDGLEYDHKIYRTHLCPSCGNPIIPFADGTKRGHCPTHETVVYVSVLETDAHLFREAVKTMKEGEK